MKKETTLKFYPVLKRAGEEDEEEEEEEDEEEEEEESRSAKHEGTLQVERYKCDWLTRLGVSLSPNPNLHPLVYVLRPLIATVTRLSRHQQTCEAFLDCARLLWGFKNPVGLICS